MSLLRSRPLWSWLPLLAVAACNTPNGGGPTSDFPFNGGAPQPAVDAGAAEGPGDSTTGGTAGTTGGGNTGAASTTGGTGSITGLADAGSMQPPTTGGDTGHGGSDASAPPESTCSPDAGAMDAGPDAGGDAEPTDAAAPDVGEGGPARPNQPNPCDAGTDGATQEAGSSAPHDAVAD